MNKGIQEILDIWNQDNDYSYDWGTAPMDYMDLIGEAILYVEYNAFLLWALIVYIRHIL